MEIKTDMKTTRKKEDKFIQGWSCCLASIIKGHGCNTEHTEAFREISAKYPTESDMRKVGIDDFDIEIYKEAGLL